MRVRLDNFTKRFGSTTVIDALSLDIESGEMLALLGPSGCGKSTTLFAICGIHRLDEGRLLFGDRDVSSLPSQKRNVGIVFQNYALYPHMNAYDNIAFPLRVRKDSATEVDRKVREIAALVHIEELLQRRPAELSGGQQQRVALSRALVRRPDILLLDEPLANLDARLRLEMRSEIRRVQLETGITAVLVTHDQVEAMSMCDRIAIMRQGRIEQLADPSEMYRQPASDFVAGFLGNPPIAFVSGQFSDGQVHLANSAIRLPIPRLNSRIDDGITVKLGIRPEHYRPGPGATVAGVISFVEHQGREILYDVTLDNGEILRSIQDHDQAQAIGDCVQWSLAVDHALVFDQNGARL